MHALLLAVTLGQLIANARAQESVCWAGEDGDPHLAVCDAIHDHVDEVDVIRAVASELGVSQQTAAVIAEVELREWNVGAEAELLDHRLRAALHENGNHLPILITIAQIEAMNGATANEFVSSILPLLRAEPNPVATIIRVAKNVGTDRSLPLLAAAMGDYRDDMQLLEALAIAHPLRAAFGPARISGDRVTLRAAARKLPPDILGEHVQRQITDLLWFGRPAEALALYDLLPDAARAQVDGMYVELAAAAALEHDDARARKLLEKASPQRYEGDRLGKQIVETAIAPRIEGDVFDMVVAAMYNQPSPTLARLYAVVLERAGYPAVAAEVLRNLPPGWNRTNVYTAPPIAAEVDSMLTLLEADAKSLRARADVLAPLPDPALRRLLETPRIPYAHEYPMPARVDAAAVPLPIDTTRPLDHFAWAFRIEQSGSERIALATSPSLDPAGWESGAYWILRSHDDGATWTSYYTGLRASAYPAAEESRLPILDGDRVRIELKSGGYVEVAWDVLTRDSDGDGLTDLVEERIVTDPRDPDSDDDGIPDGVDRLPQIARCDASTPESAILAEALRDDKNEYTRFVIAPDSAQFFEVDPNAQLTVLNAADHALYEKKFGSLQGTFVRNFAIDHSGTRAVIALDHGTSGSKSELRKTNGAWKVVNGQSWIF